MVTVCHRRRGACPVQHRPSCRHIHTSTRWVLSKHCLRASTSVIPATHASCGALAALGELLPSFPHTARLISCRVTIRVSSMRYARVDAFCLHSPLGRRTQSNKSCTTFFATSRSMHSPVAKTQWMRLFISMLKTSDSAAHSKSPVSAELHNRAVRCGRNFHSIVYFVICGGPSCINSHVSLLSGSFLFERVVMSSFFEKSNPILTHHFPC